VIVQDEAYGQSSPLVLVVPLTSNLDALRFPATIRLEPLHGSGLRLPSVAMIFQLRAIDRGRFVQRLGQLNEEALKQILAEMDKLTGRRD
jgi:mRNA interferase MazF